MPTLAKAVPVTEVPAADPDSARKHFESLLEFETDCWDVHASLEATARNFIVLDVRSSTQYSAGHVGGAENLPHRLISERTLAKYDPEILFVVYCDGPHCNGADRAALQLARLGRRVKKMIGGIEGWKDDGFSLVKD